MTIGIIATNPGGYEMLDLIDSDRRGRRSHDRPVALPGHHRAAVVRDPPAVRPAARSGSDVRALPLDEQMRALRDPAVRERLVDAAMQGDYSRWRGIGAMPRKPDFDGIRVYLHGLPPNPTVDEVAAARGVTPAEAMIDLALETDFEQLFIQPSLYPQDPDVLLTVHAPPAHGDDVLRLGRAPQPDRRRVDPHPPARPLGARPRRSSRSRRRCA